MSGDKLKPLPHFGSDQEEIDFWRTHDSSEYQLGEPVEVDVDAEARTRAISIRLPERLLRDLKAEATRRGMPYQRLIREVLERRPRPLTSAAAEPRASYTPGGAGTVVRARQRMYQGGAASSKKAA